MNAIEAFILGIVQGLTEFLPVSSSGHLTIAGTLFGMSGEENLAFAIVVHIATVLSTVVVLWREIVGLFAGLFAFRWNDDTRTVCKLLLSAVPVGIVGLFCKDAVEAFFGNGLIFVGCMLLVTALLLGISYYARPRLKENISFLDALVIGIAQACAVLPGLSRSGSTIATGIMLGNNKEKVAKFSFLMVIIPVLGEALLDLLKVFGGDNDASFGAIPANAMLIGFIAAFVSGMAACRWMISIVKKGKLIYFAIYCIIMGLIAIFAN
ncbi:MAG: undecaprenyl-diphosphate phosphatase [Bacteroidales bacterium]|jgi:undecaprenyl-diphosphatase|nr:undecaprenyl-diphosphate phosphatase [Bacteroidales bacterium]